MNSFFSRLLNLLFPQSQEVAELEKLAREQRLHELPPGKETPDPWIHALFHYRNPSVRALVWEIKYRGNPVLTSAATECLYEAFLGFVGENKGLVGAHWILIPIPSSKKRLREYGFSQTRKLAGAVVAHDTHHLLHYRPHIIKKIRETSAQTDLKDRRERLKNLSGAFTVVHPEEIQRKRIVLLDDVTTTGSTLREVRAVLLSAGAQEVIALTLAH